MEDYIQISKLNDFIFCPKSLYFHGIFENYSEKTYHEAPQTKGKIAHENIDKGKYSSLKKIMQGTDVYSDKLGLCGKIDIFDKETGELVERKYLIKKIYDGYIFQLYAQALCLNEMGYKVKKLFFHSLSDNKRYEIKFPDEDVEERLISLVSKINNYDIFTDHEQINVKKCDNCIYKSLCHK